jgi:hypothetical protein
MEQARFEIDPANDLENQILEEVMRTQEKLGNIEYHYSKYHPKFRSEYSRLELKLKQLEKKLGSFKDVNNNNDAYFEF